MSSHETTWPLSSRTASVTVPMWLWPRWWFWSGMVWLLVLVLGVGLPALCVVHCLVLEHHHTEHAGHMLAADCSVAAPFSQSHSEPPAVLPAILSQMPNLIMLLLVLTLIMLVPLWLTGSLPRLHDPPPRLSC